MKDNRPTLNTILIKMRNISQNEFSGDIDNNSLAIFNKLTTYEKKTLIYYLIHISIVVNENKSNNTTDIKNREDDFREKVIKEAEDPEYLDKLELIKLKSWLTKTVVKAILIIGGAVIVVMVMMNHGDGIPKLITNAKTIIDVIFPK